MAARSTIASTFVSAVASLVLAAPGIASEIAASAPVPAIHWEACADAPAPFECATVSVPLDYHQPRGEQTFLALARIPASDPAHKIGTLFVNPGGPGGSGVQQVVEFSFGRFIHTLLQGRFDVVGFDPRGVVRSDPVFCFATPDEETQFFTSQPVFPYSSSQETPFFDAFRGFSEQCRRRGARIAPHMSTADVARDLDLLRRAVGDERLTYIGFSYGSYLGNTYANLFPEKVRALVIDSVLDPRLWSSGWQVRSDRTATAAVLEEFMRLCDEAQTACPLSNAAGASARYFALARALREQPFVFEDGSVYSYDFLVRDTAITLYAPETWGGSNGWAAFVASLADAVLGADATAAREARSVRQSLVARLHPGRENYLNYIDAYYGNQCADTQYPETLAEFHAISEFAESGSIFGPYWWWQNSACASWPVARDRYAGPWTARTAAPVLVVGTFFDPATAYAGAVASSQLLPNSRLLSYAGVGHEATPRSDCVAAYVANYLLEGTLPPENTVCPASANPFRSPPELRSTRQVPLIGVPPMRELLRVQ